MLKRILSISIVLGLALLLMQGLTGCGSKKVVKDTETIATWGDTSMTVANFKHKMLVRHRNEPTAQKQPFDERMRILNEYVVRDCKILEGYRLGFNEREELVKAYNDAIERKATELLYNAKIRDAYITRDMMTEFWKHDQYEVRCSHILIKVDADATPADTMKAWEKVNDVYTKSKAGEDFAKLVDKYSEDTSIDKNLHGDLGYFSWGKMVDEFQEAAWNLEKGEVSKPVRTRYGYHLIQLIDKRPTNLRAITSHILVKVGKVSRTTTPAETLLAYERAMEILEKAQKSGADFAQLARQYSEDKNTWVNGFVGLIPKGSMPSDYWEVAMEMKPGEVKGPVRTYKGYHIIKMHEMTTTEPTMDDPDVESRVYSRLMRVNRDSVQARTDAFLEKIKRDREMKYNEDVVDLMLRKLTDKTAPQNMNLFSSFTAKERDMVVVSDNIGGLKIEDLVNQLGDHRAPPNIDQGRQSIYDLIEMTLMPKYLSLAAKEAGFFDDPEARSEAKKAMDNSLLPLVEQEMIYDKAAPTEEEMKKYYDENIEKEFTTPAKATVYEIMINDAKKADQFYRGVKSGEDISKLARRHTMRQEAKRKGGKLGPFTEDEYGEVSQQAFKLKPGELAGPIKVGSNYSIIKLIEKNPKKVKPFEEARKQIESDMTFTRQKEIKKAWEAELVSSYKVTYDEALVKRVWPLIDPLPEPMEDERKQWKKDREAQAKIITAENKIKVPVTPGKTQTITKDGKKFEIKFGEPRTVQNDKGASGKDDGKQDPDAKQPKMKLQMNSGGK